MYLGFDSIFSSPTLRYAPSQSPPALESSNRSRRHFTRDTVRILEQWLEACSDKPYPTKEDKTFLAQRTGLGVAQVSTWFANARRRRKYGTSRKGSLTSQSIESCSDFQLPTAEQWSTMNPLDRWENSPPEIEPAPLEAIMSAVADSDSNKLAEENFRLASSTGSERRHSASAGNDAQSVVSSNPSWSALSSSSNSSAHSSNVSGGSFGRFYLDETTRRRRRRRQKTSKTVKTEKRPFQCTFCTDKFRTKHDWMRHEKTLHLSLESFTCAPFGPVYRNTTDTADHCIFCDEPNPTEAHMEGHRFTGCQKRPSNFRTFYRKDHLIQHLRLIHGVTHVLPVIETWKSQIQHINSRCGFCSKTFTLWSERNDHIAQHFRDGALMKDWQGCRGLDAPVALGVENAMPPYLIGNESTGMNPFSASRLADNSGDMDYRDASTSSKPTLFEHLTAHLAEYVQRMINIGEAVTDEMLQKEARCVLYCDDDPWNQTPADNAEWLKLFKEAVGMEQTEFSGDLNSDNPSFFLPWSADQWTPFRSSPGMDLLDLDNTYMPWPWQSPECLVQIRRNMQPISPEQCEQEDIFAGFDSFLLDNEL
ncbi:hypothetical protein ASPVEDRAFT_144776 [Aspergillus versicolor CBS 583.65]|uniref:Homeobox domain-containing protein n=1 Tax=Aspergillus versicolor CBS 583.65 TaxID=1036611 RepID=A0A1L9Q4F5_ASPVE|nr:uncharacterized protein ASPVEDRAFT_144776 [Aspergillus versicolor CBS 583.65]OJJ08647.1 hypothetical protein ASPVEDRAFT_144776 [Aspergillus versicolor CBS 583.65]